MALRQQIGYSSSNSYFAGFLQALAKKSGIGGKISQTKGSVELLLDESDNVKLEEFGKLTKKYLPHSVFLGEIQSEQIDKEVKSTDFRSEAFNIGLCPQCLETVADPASGRYLDDSLLCDHYSNEPKQFSDSTIFSPHYSEGDTLLVTDAESLYNLFIVTDDEVKTLFSIEKPTVKVTVQDPEIKELTEKNFINIRFPYNMKSTLAALNAKESGLKYLFFPDSSDKKVVVVQKNFTFVKDNDLTASMKNLDEDPQINRVLNIAQEAEFTKGVIGAYLSQNSGISFIVSNEIGAKKVIKFQPFVLKDILEEFAENETKSKLFKNYQEKFPKEAGDLTAGSEQDLFETLSTLLGLEQKSFEALCDKSYEFRGNGGLKIDTQFTADGFDYGSFIGSVMSFKLAEVEKHYLAYSIFEAIGDMAISILNQLKTEFKIENFVMAGDLFENSVLYSRILSKFQLSNPYFPKSFGLDG